MAGYVSADIHHLEEANGEKHAFNAAQYGFFDLGGDDDALDGGLEDGIEAPPEEEFTPTFGVDLEGEDEDFSTTSLFGAMRLGPEDSQGDSRAQAKPNLSFGDRTEFLEQYETSDFSRSAPASGGAAHMESLFGGTQVATASSSFTSTSGLDSITNHYPTMGVHTSLDGDPVLHRPGHFPPVQHQRPFQSDLRQHQPRVANAEDLEAQMLAGLSVQQQHPRSAVLGAGHAPGPQGLHRPPGVPLPMYLPHPPGPPNAQGGGGLPGQPHRFGGGFPGAVLGPGPRPHPHPPPPQHFPAFPNAHHPVLGRPFPEGMPPHHQHPPQPPSMPLQRPGMPPPLRPAPPPWPHPPPRGWGPPPPHGMPNPAANPSQALLPGGGLEVQRAQHAPTLFGPRFARPQMPQQLRRQLPEPDFKQMLGKARKYGSKHMEADEIESILRIQWKSLHSGSPYVEDYYFMAFMNKHRNRKFARQFAPDQIRDLGPTERVGREPTAYVKLEGLGKIPFSNIRRPRPLMDLEVSGPAKEPKDDEAEDRPAAAKTLEQEPLMAARIMIEDCMCLLLDVDDIDRTFSSAAAAGQVREDEAVLCQRRMLLVEGLSASMRLPESAVPPAAAGLGARAGVTGDGVFMRLMALRKGRTLLARALRLLYPPDSDTIPGGVTGRGRAPLRIVWATLRNVRALFSLPAAAPQGGSDADASSQMVEGTSKVATALAEVMRCLDSPRAVCDCMAALVHGDLAAALPAAGAGAGPEASLLPLYPPGFDPKAPATHRDWLMTVLVALLTRAEELGLSEHAFGKVPGRTGLAQAEAQLWQSSFVHFFTLAAKHIKAILKVYKDAKAQGVDSAAEFAKRVVPVAVIRATLPHSDSQQRELLRMYLAELQ